MRFCRRCSLDIRLDKKRSLHMSLAFLIAAIAFYIPANIYPILQTSKFSHTSGSTIFEGVMDMWISGDYPIALIIFIASILIPLLKFLVLLYLVFTIGTKSCKSIKQRVQLYHLIEATGPWSLIDVFVVVVLVALIHFKNIVIIPGVGVSSFALMVVCTILSSSMLDERLLGAECGK